METTHSAVERIFRRESDRVLAALIGYLGDFELVEDAFQEALLVALELAQNNMEKAFLRGCLEEMEAKSGFS